MKAIGFCGWSGSGKTTLIEQLIPRFKAAGQRVSVVKHAHHAFDIDQPGKDSWRHRQAGAFEVVVASNRRMAIVREFEAVAELSVHDLLAELSACDWAVVEGFRHADLPRIEVWRTATGQLPRYAQDPHIVAIATDQPDQLPTRPNVPVLDLNQPAAVLAFLLQDPARYEYHRPRPKPTDLAG
jgi:molybdopterin-guanine dinucleotide biosynthesis adapter protein